MDEELSGAREGMADDGRGPSALASPLSVSEPLPPQTSTPASFKVHMWQSQRFDSGVQTMTHSQAPSMMSMTSLHAASQMSSHMSSMADDLRPELTDQQQERFSSLPSSFQASGQPADLGQAVQAIPELCKLMSDADDVVVYKAVSMMQNIAKLDSESHRPIITGPEVVFAIQEVLQMRAQYTNIIRVALGTIFHICNRSEGLENVLNVVLTQKDYFFGHIIANISTIQHSCYKYALLTLHSLLSEKTQGRRVIELARQHNTLELVTNWLDKESSEKLLPVIVDIVRLLCDRNLEQRTLFLRLGGAQKLLHICKHHNYQNLLLRSTQLLKFLANHHPEIIAEAGGFEILSPQLARDSPKLVNATLECFRNMSDVAADRIPHPMMPVLQRILNLIGTPDPQTMQYCMQILSNMCANKQPNKEFLCQKGAVNILLRALIVTSAEKKQMQDAPKQQLYEEIHVSESLERWIVSHSFMEQVQLQVFAQPAIFLEKLVDMRPAILKQTLLILNKAAVQDQNLAAFRDVFLPRRCDSQMGYAPENAPPIFFSEQLVYLLRVSCNQISQTQKVEEVKLGDLIQLTLSTLQLLAKERGLLMQIVHFLLRQDNMMSTRDGPMLLPAFALLQRYVPDEAIKRSALGCISALCAHPQIAQMFHPQTPQGSHIKHYCRSDDQALKTYADQAMSRCINGGQQLPCAPPYIPPPQPAPYMDHPMMPQQQPVIEAYGGDYRAGPPEYYDERKPPLPVYPHSQQQVHPQQRYPPPVPRPPQASPRGDTGYPSPRNYPPYDSPSTSRGYSSGGSYPQNWQDEGQMAVDDPFVSVFCHNSDSPSFSSPQSVNSHFPPALESVPVSSPVGDPYCGPPLPQPPPAPPHGIYPPSTVTYNPEYH